MELNQNARERWQLVGELNEFLEKPMIALSLIWLGLMVLDLTAGLSPPLLWLHYAIWALFGLHFLLGIVIAPSKLGYVRGNWLTAIALVLPALRLLRILRVFRLLRAARAARSVTLLRVVAALNRWMRSVNLVMARRGVGYVAVLTAAVTLGGAAGMAQFESPAALREAGHDPAAIPGGGLASFAEALWWTAMVMTTMGSEYWPRTPEGRILGWLLAVYALAMFGYITATIASLFVGVDVTAGRTSDTSRMAADAALREEVAALRLQVTRLADTLADRPAAGGQS